MENPKKVLIVEDDLDYLSILQQVFEKEGFVVVAARDGVEGFSLAQKGNLDLIILDILMPRMNGIEAAKRIKESNIKTPIIFLTNLSDMDSMSRAVGTVMTDLDYIVKADVKVGQIVGRAKEKLGIK